VNRERMDEASARMDVDIRSEGTEVSIRLVGELAESLPAEAYDRIHAFARRGAHVVLDLSKLARVSAVGLRRLLSFCLYVKALGGEVSAIGVPKELIRIADVTGFSQLFQQASRAVPRPLPSGPPVTRVDSYPTHYHGGYALRPGFLLPFGASAVPHGINFSVYSRHARACTLVLFQPGVRDPMIEIPFPPEFRVGDVYAMMVFEVDPDEVEYGFRIEGPFAPEEWHRFDPSKVLLDPMARCVSGRDVWGIVPDSSRPYRYRARILPEDFDWEGDRPLELPIQDLVVYEMHVRGFTRSPSSGVDHPGTFAGVREKIPYLKELGVNCVGLMPVFEFDELENDRTNPLTGERLYNYWGYSTVGFYAPNASYGATGPVGMQADELKAIVKDLHRNGIEVILDVVFNHTAEGDDRGPCISFRGLDNRTYYMLTPDGRYYNFSGCGNTLNCNHPVVRDFVLNCLRYWVEAYHIDGFRFDLASILGRDAHGTPLPNPPLLESLAMDPILGKTKLIAEAWDAGGLYQVGTFPAYGRWADWNGKYRDCVRRFLKGDAGLTGEM
jgi:isoamylase